MGSLGTTETRSLRVDQRMALPRFLLGVSAAIIAMLAVVGALALLALGAAAFIRIVVPDSEVVKGTALSRPVAWAQSLQPRAGADEAQAARETSLGIRQWLVRCSLAAVDKYDIAQPTNPTDPLFDHLSQIANALYNDRLSLAKDIDSTFTVVEWGTIAGILIGMATTICAGLRSDDQALGTWARTVRILAIVFPALGTAVAAFAAFYGPREELLRASQSLVSLQQLHTEVQVGLSREPCPMDADGHTRILNKLVDWENKLIPLRPATTAARIGARAKDSSRAGSGL